MIFNCLRYNRLLIFKNWVDKKLIDLGMWNENLQKSSEEVERISTKFETPFRASSSGSVTIRSISSAVLPG